MALTDLTRISTAGIATGTSLSGAILHGDAHFRGTNAGINSAIFDSSENELNLKDNVKLTFGNAGTSDSQFYFDSNNLILQETSASGSMLLRGQNIRLQNASQSNENYIECLGNNADRRVKIYQGTTTRFETTSTGAKVTGILTATEFSGPMSNGSGISTFYNLRVSNNLTVEGTTTTLDTNVTGVDRLEVNANSNTDTAIVGIQSGTADIVNLFDGTTKVLTVDDTGNVGIGTDNPNHELTVYGDEPNFRLTHTGSTNTLNALYTSVDGTGATFNSYQDVTATKRPFIFKQYTSEVLRISSTGEVGIGTNNPKTKLNIHTFPHSDTGGILVQNANYTSNLDKAYLIAGTQNWTGAVTNWNTYGFQHKLKTDSNGIPRLTIDGAAGGGNLNEIITFSANAKVGISTINPQNTLEVVGAGVSVFNEAKNAAVDISGSGKIELIRSDSVAYIDFKTSYGEDFDCRIQHYSNGLRFYTGGHGTTDERLRIDSGGRLFTGASQTLLDSTAGTIHISGGTSGRLAFRGTTTSAETGIAEVFAFWDTNKVAGMIAKSGTDTTNKDDGSLHFYTSASGPSVQERLTITSGGTVGINDSTPNTYFKLDVNGHTNIVGDVALPTTNRIYWGNSDTAFIKGEHGGSAYLSFGANNEKMRLTRAGNLGIGTDNPTYVLHTFTDGVPPSSWSTENDRKYNGRFTTYTGNRLNLDIYDRRWQDTQTHGWIGTEKRIEYNVDDNTTKRMWISFINPSSTTADNAIRFGEQEGTEWMRIDNGNLGIGSVAPVERLVVQGDVNSFLAFDKDGGGFDGTSGGALVLGSVFDYSGARLGLYADNAGAGRLMTKTGQSLFLGTNNTRQLSINNIGYVGIKTTNALAHLDIRGVSGSGSPTVAIHHSNVDVEGEAIRIGRTDINTIRYHSIKAKHSGSAASNYISFNVHTGSTTTSQTELLKLKGDNNVLVGGSFAAGNVVIDPDSYSAYSGGFGNVNDGSGWGARGLWVHGGGTGDAAAIAHNGNHLYFGIQDGTANSMHTYARVDPATTGNIQIEKNVAMHNAVIRRNQYNKGHLEGGHNNIGGSNNQSNPIFTIGSSYNPDTTSLSNMYGIGFCAQSASFINSNVTGGWGMYAASDGDARIFLNAGDGRIFPSQAYGRVSHQTGYLEGGHQNIGATSVKTSPIYCIGSSYTPNEEDLNNMYGVGYSNGAASFLPTAGWGMYVASDGDARIFLDATNGDILFHSNARGALHFNNGTWSGDQAKGKIQTHANHMYLQNAGNTGSWAFRLPNATEPYVINYQGTVSGSDVRRKKDIKTITGAVDTIKQLIGRSFTWREADTKGFGVIAQEVEKVLPDLVTTQTVIEGEENDDPYKMMNYTALSGHFIEAIKELATKIETLEQENTALKARVTTLEG